MSEETKKVLIVGSNSLSGSAGGARVTGVLWDDLDSRINPKDFDIIIFDVTRFADGGVFAIPDFIRMDFSSTMNILRHGGKIVVVGNPDFSYFDSVGDHVPFLNWTGALFSWDGASGDTIVNGLGYDKKKHDRYLCRLSKWDNSLKSVVGYGPSLADFFGEDILRRGELDVDYIISPIITNRYKQSIAFSVSIRFEKDRRSDTLRDSILFLPSIDLPEEEYLKIILSDNFGIEFETRQPAWVSEIVGPMQGEVDEQIESIQMEILEMTTRLDALHLVRAERRSCIKLLYAKDFELECEVWDILRKLGAEVIEPIERGKEDGWISVDIEGETLKGVLEIKSTSNEHFNEGGLRQLLEWVNRGIVHKQEKFKGIFIGNSSAEMPLDSRVSPFSDSWKRSAKLGDVCGITTALLFNAYKKHIEEGWDTALLWKRVFSTAGVLEDVPL